MIERFECGCVRIVSQNFIVLIDNCNDSSDSFSFKLLDKNNSRYQDLMSKKRRVMSLQGQECFIKELDSLISDGYRFRKIQKLLNTKMWYRRSS